MQRTTLCILEQSVDGGLQPLSHEALTAARQLGGHRLLAALPGFRLDPMIQMLNTCGADELWLIDHERLADYTPDAYLFALHRLIDKVRPDYVVFPHTYQVRDYVPRLAARLQRSLISDCVAIRSDGDALTLIRPVFQGRALAEVVPQGATPHLLSVQAGAFPAAQGSGAVKTITLNSLTLEMPAECIRTRPEKPFRAVQDAVDLRKAKAIVAIGRGIKSEQHIALARRLAELLGAELAATRPVCDEGWLPPDRQVGSSGQTVAPRLYVALGISGAAQHLVGMKGAEIIVAVNKDPNAAIFKVADYGVVGDLLEVVPALIHHLEAIGR
jgi:electron transfer flavoprotein alpha subunit